MIGTSTRVIVLNALEYDVIDYSSAVGSDPAFRSKGCRFDFCLEWMLYLYVNNVMLKRKISRLLQDLDDQVWI